MRESSSRIRCTAKDSLNGEMDLHTKETGLKIHSMDMVSQLELTEAPTLASSKMEKDMDTVSRSGLMEEVTMATGSWIKSQSKLQKCKNDHNVLFK